MHTNETKNQFIELRADGLSFDVIAEKLNVSKRTLIRWQRDHDAEIRSLRAVELDALYDKIFASREVEAQRLAAVQARVEETLVKYPICIDMIKTSAFVRKEIREFRKHTVEAFLPAAPKLTVQPPATTQPTAAEVQSPAAAATERTDQ